ncbi:MAG: hypothetical protein MUC31_05770, partial [Bacteroidales bacterium]|nr:hypothetical protein [Bacteroidales bacterium]
MEKRSNPFDDFLKEALKDHHLVPREEAKRDFLREASTIIPARNGWKNWYYLPILALFIIGLISLLLYTSREDQAPANLVVREPLPSASEPSATPSSAISPSATLSSQSSTPSSIPPSQAPSTPSPVPSVSSYAATTATTTAETTTIASATFVNQEPGHSGLLTEDDPESAISVNPAEHDPGGITEAMSPIQEDSLPADSIRHPGTVTSSP